LIQKIMVMTKRVMKFGVQIIDRAGQTNAAKRHSGSSGSTWPQLPPHITLEWIVNFPWALLWALHPAVNLSYVLL
jgi:hypothetical protein